MHPLQQAPRQHQEQADTSQSTVATSHEQVLVDNRPQAETQRKLAQLMNNSPRVLRQRALSDAMHNSPQMLAQRRTIKGLCGGVGQPQERGAAPSGLTNGIVQRKFNWGEGTDDLNIEKNTKIDIPAYAETQRRAREMEPEIHVTIAQHKQGVASYVSDPNTRNGQITIRKSLPTDEAGSDWSRYIAMAHETRHAIDDLARDVPDFRKNQTPGETARVVSEWRAFATQAAVSQQMLGKGHDIDDRFKGELASYASPEAFMHPDSVMFRTTLSYMKLYGLVPSSREDDLCAEAVKKFMTENKTSIVAAIGLYRQLAQSVHAGSAAQDNSSSSSGPGTAKGFDSLSADVPASSSSAPHTAAADTPDLFSMFSSSVPPMATAATENQSPKQAPSSTSSSMHSGPSNHSGASTEIGFDSLLADFPASAPGATSDDTPNLL